MGECDRVSDEVEAGKSKIEAWAAGLALDKKDVEADKSEIQAWAAGLAFDKKDGSLTDRTGAQVMMA